MEYNLFAPQAEYFVGRAESQWAFARPSRMHAKMNANAVRFHLVVRHPAIFVEPFQNARREDAILFAPIVFQLLEHLLPRDRQLDVITPVDVHADANRYALVSFQLNGKILQVVFLSLR